MYLDIRDTHLPTKVTFQEVRLFEDFLKKEVHGIAVMAMTFSDDDLSYITNGNNLMHSFLSNLEVLSEQSLNLRIDCTPRSQGFNFQFNKK